MRAAIPRYLLTKPGPQQGTREWFGTQLSGGHRALFAFSSRERAEQFLAQAESLGSGWQVTFLGYTELRQWLGECREAGYDLLVRDLAGLAEIAVEAAQIPALLHILASREDTGEEIQAEFQTYPGARLL